MRVLVLLALLALTGCTGICNVTVFGVSKAANATAAPLTPETYCMALLSPNLALKGGTKLKPPSVTAEQAKWCAGILAQSKEQESLP